MQVLSFDKAASFVAHSIGGFIGDPASSDFQRGYLAALLAVYSDGLGLPIPAYLTQATEQVASKWPRNGIEEQGV